jgi:regulator of sigma E protease
VFDSIIVNPVMQQLLAALWSLSSFIVAIVVLVTVHEFGHFWVARKLGVKVLRFSVGFGKPLFSWHDRVGCEYVIAAIPFGGYVKMLDEREEPVSEAELPFSFGRQAVWKRSLIVLAGPVANFLLAILVFWALFAGGQEGVAPVIGRVDVASMAERAGVQVGQEIVSVDGIETPTTSTVFEALIPRVGDTGELALGVRYPGDTNTYELLIDLRRWLSDAELQNPVASLGLHFYTPPFVLVFEVLPGSAAEQAGLRKGDVIERLDGKPVADIEVWLTEVRSKPEQVLMLGVRRDGAILDIAVTPAKVIDKKGQAVGQIGTQISPPPMDKQYIRHLDYSIPQALWRGIEETGKQTHVLVVTLYKLLVGDLSPKNLSGPLGIAKVAGDSAGRGLAEFCYMLAFFSINLGVINLLPIPVLDGGHLLLNLVEAVKGSPVSEKIQMVGSQIGLVMIASLMLFAVYNDFLKL